MSHPYDSFAYTVPVTRDETHTVSRAELLREKAFRAAQAERKAGLPCRSANGTYLDGWYNPDAVAYFIPRAALHLLANV
jgi:hypothetical protein